MAHTIALKLKPETYQRFKHIYAQLNAGETESLAKSLGENLADMSCEVVDQVFGSLVRISNSTDNESAKILKQVMDNLRKYMPWSVSFFGNDRLTPMVNYLESMTFENNQEFFLTYSVDDSLVAKILADAEHIKQGKNEYIVPALKAFTQVVDQGVIRLIREPKKMLKFNLMVDKTLNGIIHVTTQLGYKRFDKLATLRDAKTISIYFDHFLEFIDTRNKLGF